MLVNDVLPEFALLGVALLLDVFEVPLCCWRWVRASLGESSLR